MSTRVRSAPLLARLASLRWFDLFICLTPDDCLVDALRQVHGRRQRRGERLRAERRQLAAGGRFAGTAGIGARLLSLGRSATGSRLAIHEEDALEFLYKFQEDGVRRAPVLLGELRRRDLLLLGCNLPDWLGRGFLRLANEFRLSSQDKKMEFFAADAQGRGAQRVPVAVQSQRQRFPVVARRSSSASSKR